MDTESIAEWVQKVIFRQADYADLPAMEWEGEFRHFRNLYADAYRRTLRHTALIWLAELPDAGLIGQLMLQLTSERQELADGVERAYLFGFRIRPAYRSQGLGTCMIQHVEEDLRQRGFTRLTLNVARENLRAQNLYTRLGFVVVGSEPGIWSFIDDTGRRRWVEEPAWRMEKRL